MTVRNLESLFAPKAVALIGATDRPGSLGAAFARNLIGAGFSGPIMPVNPKRVAVAGTLAYPDVKSLPVVPDLAIVNTPIATVPQLISDLGTRGCRAAIVVAEAPEPGGAAIRQAMLDAARPHLLRVLGPHCHGVMVPGRNLSASLTPVSVLPGKLAFIAQSNAVVGSVLDWARPRNIGFSAVVSAGDMADVDLGDLIDWFASDRRTSAILLYLESVTSARKFMSAARAAARVKPVIALKAGRQGLAAQAAATHARRMASDDAVYDAAIRRAGMLRVSSLEELFEAVGTIAIESPALGERLVIVSNGGGAGVLASDAAIDEGAALMPLSAETMERLKAEVPDLRTAQNPIDLGADAAPERYERALKVLAQDRSVDAVLAIHSPSAISGPTRCAEVTIKAMEGLRRPRLLACWLGDSVVAEARAKLGAAGVPQFETPGQAVRGFHHMVEFHRNQELLTETPPSIPMGFTPELERVRDFVARRMAEGGGWLTTDEALDLIAAYGVPISAARVASSPAEAAGQAAEIGFPVALKIRAREILHKRAAGGVALDLEDARAVERAAEGMLARIAAAGHATEGIGFTVQAMAHRPDAVELILGMVDDLAFGPVMLIGHGGTAAEVIDDKAMALPPLNTTLAHAALARTRVSRILAGFPGTPPADREGVALSLVKLGQLVADVPEIAEMEVNPLIADASGVLALDARIRLAQPRLPSTRRFAIRPYPKALEQEVELPDGRRMLLRPIMPEDERPLQAGFAKVRPEHIRLRFFAPLKELSHRLAAKLTQIDYDREMAFVLVGPGAPGEAEWFGTVRLVADPDNERGEYAVLLRSDLIGQGIGRLLMERIIDYGRSRGLSEIYGEVLRENTGMLHLAAELGFRVETDFEDMDIVKVRLPLR
jgi:acetyltransferase